MPQKTYRIRKSFLLPLAVDVILLLALLILSCAVRGSALERAVLIVLFIVTLLVLSEAARRVIMIGEGGLKIAKFFRIKDLAWPDITHIGCLSVRSRVYILLTTTQGFYVISNAYDRFSEMIRDIIEHIPSESVEVEAEARGQIEHPTRNVSDLIAAWIAAAVLTGIIYLKLVS